MQTYGYGIGNQMWKLDVRPSYFMTWAESSYSYKDKGNEAQSAAMNLMDVLHW